MAIRAIIIDDERLARNELKKLLQDHSDIDVIECRRWDRKNRIAQPRFNFLRHSDARKNWIRFISRSRKST